MPKNLTTITIQRLHLLHSVHPVHAAFYLFQISRFCDYITKQIMDFAGYVLFTDLVATKKLYLNVLLTPSLSGTVYIIIITLQSHTAFNHHVTI